LLRIGTGYDAHQLVENRPLIIGGIDIPHPKGLLGHSDADVLVHALMDALLGAMSLGSIGDLFPDTDKQFKNISSLLLLAKVIEIMQEKGFELINTDSVIIAQEPKLKPFIPLMQKKLAEAFGVNLDQVSIKATTTENLGFEGRKEGIGAQSVVLLQKR